MRHIVVERRLFCRFIFAVRFTSGKQLKCASNSARRNYKMLMNAARKLDYTVVVFLFKEKSKNLEGGHFYMDGVS